MTAPLRALAAAAIVVLAGCGSTDSNVAADRPASMAPQRATGDDLERASAWMAGSFSSAEQAASDDRYYDVVLHHAPIWTDRTDGSWFSIEQAIAASADKPYRQRVYRLWLRPDGYIESTVYEMPEPDRFVDAWRDPSVFDAVSPDDLIEREGCAVVLTPLGDAFSGGTVGNGCASSLRGAAYATSKVDLAANEIRSWDQGFDADGMQVWGAEAGPYVFNRVR